MTRNDFEQHLTSFFVELRNLTNSKGVEYANSDDQLANFKRLGLELGLPPEAVLMVFLTKHLDSLKSAIRSGGKTLSESFRGRCTDAVLYLILLDALHAELNQPVHVAIKQDLDPLPCPTDPPSTLHYRDRP